MGLLGHGRRDQRNSCQPHRRSELRQRVEDGPGQRVRVVGEAGRDDERRNNKEDCHWSVIRRTGVTKQGHNSLSPEMGDKSSAQNPAYQYVQSGSLRAIKSGDNAVSRHDTTTTQYGEVR